MKTSSQDLLSQIQQRFGSADYSDWQYLRKRFYSYVNYPTAGASTFSFFGFAQGSAAGTTPEYTNMPKAGSFGQQHFWIRSISCVVKFDVVDITDWTGADATAVFSDYWLGFVQAGYLQFNINARPWLQLPVPFLYLPPFDGREVVQSNGIAALTLTEGTPNVLNAYVTAPPWATQTTEKDGIYTFDPPPLIEAEQGFDISINFPSGLVPQISTTTAPSGIRIGVILDGVLYRPLQ